MVIWSVVKFMSLLDKGRSEKDEGSKGSFCMDWYFAYVVQFLMNFSDNMRGYQIEDEANVQHFTIPGWVPHEY